MEQEMNNRSEDSAKEKDMQFSTFVVAGRLYGIDVKRVQEVTKALPMTSVPLTQDYVLGLINLRGQISTAIGLRELFQIKGNQPEETMNVVCRVDGILVSLVVDEIGDVLEPPRSDFENAPSTIDEHVRKYMVGVYKLKDTLLSVIDIDKVITVLNSSVHPELGNIEEAV